MLGETLGQYRLDALVGRGSMGRVYRAEHLGLHRPCAIKIIDPASPAVARSFATGLRRPVDLRFAADGSLYVLVRDAWVMDNLFKGGTGALLRIRYAGK